MHIQYQKSPIKHKRKRFFKWRCFWNVSLKLIFYKKYYNFTNTLQSCHFRIFMHFKFRGAKIEKFWVIKIYTFEYSEQPFFDFCFWKVILLEKTLEWLQLFGLFETILLKLLDFYLRLKIGRFQRHTCRFPLLKANENSSKLWWSVVEWWQKKLRDQIILLKA